MNRSVSRRPVPLLAAGLLALVLLQSCASAYFYDVAIARKDKSFLLKSPDLKPKPGASPITNLLNGVSSASQWLDSRSPESVTMVSDDGLKLVAWWLPAAGPSTRTVIIAHGYSMNGKTMALFARYWAEEQGCNVLLPDARGHGASEGNYIGFGWPERYDQVKWARWVIGRVGPDASIVYHGISMGGATVMMTSAEPDLPPQVKAVVEDCGYTSVYEELSWNLVRMYHLPPEPIISDTSKLTRQRAGYSFEEASALEAVKHSLVPILFIHGEADTFVPFEMVGRLYAACASEKELLTVPGAGHGQSVVVDPAAYWAKVSAFVRRFF